MVDNKAFNIVDPLGSESDTTGFPDTTSPGSDQCLEIIFGEEYYDEYTLIRAIEAEFGDIPGHTEPRVFTKPLRELTPETSEGFAVIKWCREEMHWYPMPYQCWLFIHALELLPSGLHRFRYLLVLVARQNGKSEWASYLVAYFLAHGIPMVLGTSSTIETAVESWEDCVDIIEDNPAVFGGKPRVLRGVGRTSLKTADGNKYKVAAASRKGGRGTKAVHILVEDELREHDSWDAHASADNTTVAVPNSLCIMLSNMGDSKSIVLNHFRSVGISGTDTHLGYFEYSGIPDCELTDRDSWAHANPAWGVTITEESLESKLVGPASVFRTENLCQGVPVLNALVTGPAWSACYDPGTMDAYKTSIAFCLDMSDDMKHIGLLAACVLPDERVRVEVVRVWKSTIAMRAELGPLVDRVKPRVMGWLSRGPSAALSPELKKLRKSRALSPQEVTQAVQGMSELISAGRLSHNGDNLLTSQLLTAEPRRSADGSFTLARPEGLYVELVFAMSGAVWLARQLPKPVKLRVVTSEGA